MSTRSLTRFFDEDGKPFLTMYRHMDGYPEGMGAELRAFLEPFRITNGIGADAKAGSSANGMGCLAAQAVAHFKGDTVGNVYIYGPDCGGMGEEYIYEVRKVGDRAVLVAYESDGDGKAGRKVNMSKVKAAY